MKNIIEIKKEIERKNKKHRKEAKRLNIKPLGDGNWDDTIESEAELRILQEVCKEIEKEIDKCKGYGIKKGKVNILIVLEELLKKFQGEEK